MQMNYLTGYHKRVRHPGAGHHACPVTQADIAMALELRSEGIHWKHIAWALGHTPGTLRSAVQRATKVE